MGPLRRRLIPQSFPARLAPGTGRAYLEGREQPTETAMFKGLGGLGDMAVMMKKAQEMQTRMAELQEQLHTITVTGESGAGLVKATSTAKGELIGLDIDPSIFNADDKEVVEDLILAAIKDAQMKASDRSQDEMQKLTSDLGLPADMKLPF
jgi:nucleoid-associated protein EbfC